ADQRLPDGRFNIQLRGLTRVRVLEEMENGKLYRRAKVEVLQEKTATPVVDKKLRSQLLAVVPGWCQSHGPAAEGFPKVIQSNFPLGIVCDVLGFSLPLTVGLKQELLEELKAESRTRLLLSYLQKNSPPEVLPPPQHPFPPEFSVN